MPDSVPVLNKVAPCCELDIRKDMVRIPPVALFVLVMELADKGRT